VDLMQVQEIPDWRPLARDYLGPHVLAALDAMPAPQRADGLARAWTDNEARLKCHGRQLSEWNDRPLPARLHALALPQGFVGAVATRLAHSDAD
jgi:4'-phosphopantetheinyl transferase